MFSSQLPSHLLVVPRSLFNCTQHCLSRRPAAQPRAPRWPRATFPRATSARARSRGVAPPGPVLHGLFGLGQSHGPHSALRLREPRREDPGRAARKGDTRLNAHVAFLGLSAVVGVPVCRFFLVARVDF